MAQTAVQPKAKKQEGGIKERPMMFKAPLIRAIIDGRKTQTRRLVKWKPYITGDNWNYSASSMSLGHPMTGMPSSGYCLYSRGAGSCWNQRTKAAFCPYGKPGERIWVQETFYIDDIHHLEGPVKDIENEINRDQIYYRADGECCEQIPECSCAEVGKPRWRPSMNMPRWASRITLEIVSTRIERLHAITEADAQSEGVERPVLSPEVIGGLRVHPNTGPYRDGFRDQWQKINGEQSWSDNPWVWVVEFKKV